MTRQFLAELIFVGKWFPFFYVVTNSLFLKNKRTSQLSSYEILFSHQGKNKQKIMVSVC